MGVANRRRLSHQLGHAQMGEQIDARASGDCTRRSAWSARTAANTEEEPGREADLRRRGASFGSVLITS
jgi:hypothetical protein